MKSRISGIPFPEKYDKYYITKYSLPKGLNAVKNEKKNRHNHTTNPKFYQTSLFNLKKDKKDGTFYLKARKKKQLEGFRGFKLKSWNRNDYRNMMIQNRTTKVREDSSLSKSKNRVKSSKASKRPNRKKRHGALNATIKSEHEVFSHGSTKFDSDKFKLELVDLDGKKQVLNIIDKDTYNFPIIVDSKLPLSIKPESTVLLPNPM